MKSQIRKDIKRIIQEKWITYADVGKKFTRAVTPQYVSGLLNDENRTLTIHNTKEFAQALNLDASRWYIDIALEQIRRSMPEVAELISEIGVPQFALGQKMAERLIDKNAFPLQDGQYLIENPDPNGAVPFQYLVISSDNQIHEEKACLLFGKKSRDLKVSKFFSALKQDYIVYKIEAAFDNLNITI